MSRQDDDAKEDAMVPNRRAFLKAAVNAGGLVFVGCGLTEVAGFAQPASRGTRTPVVLRGRRVRTIDMHAHCAVPKAAALLNRNGAVNAQDPLLMEGPALAERLARMDAQQIDVAVLSINPNWYDAARDVVVDVIRVQNEGLAEFCGAHADRFAALASVALQFPDLAAQQLEHAVKTLGLHGVAIGGSVAGVELSDEKLHPFWAKAEELGVVVFIHPQASGVLTNRLKGNGLLTNVIWNPLETTIALSHLIFEGTLDRFPGVKICAAHGGGYLPSYMNRSDHGCTTFPAQCKAGVPKKHPTEYVKRMYYDSLVFTPEALRHLVAEVGAGQIVMGTDYPYPWVTEPVTHILTTPGLNDASREAILGGTAAKLLGLSGK